MAASLNSSNNFSLGTVSRIELQLGGRNKVGAGSEIQNC